MKEEKILERSICSYENNSQRYVFKSKRKFDLQYSQIYAVRLMSMRKRLECASKAKWGENVSVKQLVNVKIDEKCVIIGTLFRKMELQPSIIKEIALEEGVLPLPPSSKYISADDELILEEQQQRITLTGNLDLQHAVTGTIIAVYGCESKAGKFNVDEFSFACLPKQSNVNIDQSLANNEDRYVLFISGLGIGSKYGDLFNLQLLVDLITGNLGSSQEQEMFSLVSRVIIAGDALSSNTQDKDSTKVAKYLSRNTQAKSVDAIKSLDDILVQLGSSVHVDIMPGEYDPTNQFLPQQPLHKCMLPKAHSYSTVQSVTNPYDCTVGGMRIHGTSGQNINNIYQFSGYENRLEILESTLNFSHLSPTSPDTLSCYPYFTEDPFILQDCPHVYFAGNQPEFATKQIQGTDGQSVSIICIPTFETTNTCVMVNLRDLSCRPHTIQTKLE